MAERHRLQVFLPEGWVETEPGNPRHFRNTNLSKPGCLTLGINPPRAGVSGHDEREDQAMLRDLLTFVAPQGWGQPIRSYTGPCTLGRLAWARFQSPTIGLVQVWLLGRGDVSVFANFMSGDPATAEDELGDAQAILESVDQVELINGSTLNSAM